MSAACGGRFTSWRDAGESHPGSAPPTERRAGGEGTGATCDATISGFAPRPFAIGAAAELRGTAASSDTHDPEAGDGSRIPRSPRAAHRCGAFASAHPHGRRAPASALGGDRVGSLLVAGGPGRRVVVRMDGMGAVGAWSVLRGSAAILGGARGPDRGRRSRLGASGGAGPGGCF